MTAKRHATTARLTGTGSSQLRAQLDYYATPPACTQALLQAERLPNYRIWEPACGEGHIAKVLRSAGLSVTESDIVNRSDRRMRVLNFLQQKKLLAPVIITNPPFGISTKFIEHALTLRPERLIILHKLQFLASAERTKVIEECQHHYGAGLARVHVFINRVALWKNGQPQKNGMLSFAWYVWERGYWGQPVINRIWVGDRP